MKSFGEMFPKSAHTFRARHKRLFLWNTKLLRLYYKLRAPTHLIDQSKLIKGSYPVIINNFNRLNTLRQLIHWLNELPTSFSILILDNASTYKPLLTYYESLESDNIQVIQFSKNNELRKLLPMSLALNQFDKYIVTDADLLPYPSTPDNLFEKMAQFLDDNPNINHVGPSLEIRDIPDFYPLRQDVMEWESQYWQNRHCSRSFKAEVDTTMGMYRRSSLVTKMNSALRLDRPYTLKHVDWYLNPEKISEEHQFYLENCTAVSTWNTKLKHALLIT